MKPRKNKLQRLPSNMSCTWLYFLCRAIRSCRKCDELREGRLCNKNYLVIGVPFLAPSAHFFFLCTTFSFGSAKPSCHFTYLFSLFFFFFSFFFFLSRWTIHRNSCRYSAPGSVITLQTLLPYAALPPSVSLTEAKKQKKKKKR